VKSYSVGYQETESMYSLAAHTFRLSRRHPLKAGAPLAYFKRGNSTLEKDFFAGR